MLSRLAYAARKRKATRTTDVAAIVAFVRAQGRGPLEDGPATLAMKEVANESEVQTKTFVRKQAAPMANTNEDENDKGWLNPEAASFVPADMLQRALDRQSHGMDGTQLGMHEQWRQSQVAKTAPHTANCSIVSSPKETGEQWQKVEAEEKALRDAGCQPRLKSARLLESTQSDEVEPQTQAGKASCIAETTPRGKGQYRQQPHEARMGNGKNGECAEGAKRGYGTRAALRGLPCWCGAVVYDPQPAQQVEPHEHNAAAVAQDPHEVADANDKEEIATAGAMAEGTSGRTNADEKKAAAEAGRAELLATLAAGGLYPDDAWAPLPGGARIPKAAVAAKKPAEKSKWKEKVFDWITHRWVEAAADIKILRRIAPSFFGGPRGPEYLAPVGRTWNNPGERPSRRTWRHEICKKPRRRAPKAIRTKPDIKPEAAEQDDTNAPVT